MKKRGLIILLIILLIVIITMIIAMITILNNKESNNEINLEYEIISDTSHIEGSKNRRERGNEIIQKDDDYYLIIYYGEQHTYYSSLEVSSVKIQGDDVKVTVKLPNNEGMGDAFSYPKAVIKFNKKPNNVKVTYK